MSTSRRRGHWIHAPAWRSWHRLLALVVGVQLLLWTLSGLFFTLYAIERVRGEDRLVEEVTSWPADLDAVPVAEVLREAGHTEVEAVSCAVRRGQPTYLVTHAAGRSLWDARQGTPLPELTEDEARKLAARSYRGERGITAVERLDGPAGEFKTDLPAYRVTLADDRGTVLYLDALTGEVSAVRNRVWRIFDFLWMLHIMDYRERQDFHHPLIIIAASLGVLTAVSGLALEVSWLSRKWRTK